MVLGILISNTVCFLDRKCIGALLINMTKKSHKKLSSDPQRDYYPHRHLWSCYGQVVSEYLAADPPQAHHICRMNRYGLVSQKFFNKTLIHLDKITYQRCDDS